MNRAPQTYGSYTERIAAERSSPPSTTHDYPAFQNSHAAMGGAAHRSRHAGQHYIRLAMMVAPLIIGEIVQDAGKRWRWIKIASTGGALLSEALWQHEQIARDREGRGR